MRKLTLACLVLLLTAGSAFAVGSSQRFADYNLVDVTNTMELASGGSTAKQDTVYLIGGPGRNDGKFQNNVNPNLPDAEGWTGIDLTAPAYSRWNVSTYQSPTGTPAMWAGMAFPGDCGTGDFFGYSNGFLEYLDWVGTVANPANDTLVRVTAVVSYDTEPGYDYLGLRYETPAGWVEHEVWNGTGVAEAVDEDFTFTPADYVNGNQIHLRWQADADGGASDSDCGYPSVGHSQLDNVSVYFNNVLQTFDDFNAGIGPNWFTAQPVGYGDFSKVWPLLQGLDPCIVNETPQFAFIDDGLVVPGVGPSSNTLYTYGPSGYTRNCTGGALGANTDDNLLTNEIWSPALAWPAGDYVAAALSFGQYIHSPYGTATFDGVFQVWHVRCSTDGGNTWYGWNDRNTIYYSAQGLYGRNTFVVTDLLEPGTTHVQIALGLSEDPRYNPGTDGTPASYFDNVQFYVYAYGGPAISIQGEWDLPQDQFAKNLDLTPANLANNALRFDMCQDLLDTTSPNIVHGDSIVLNIQPVRPGSALVELPKMHYKIKCNPLFDDVRNVTPVGGYIEGDVEADSVYTTGGILVEWRWAFDLDDDGLLFPGDQMHWYITATDRVNGDPGTDGTTTYPANIAGFGVFPGESGYVEFQWPFQWIWRGLPSVTDLAGTQPSILFWNDFGAFGGGINEWKQSFAQLGLVENVDYDIYYTQAPSSNVGNGLGANASAVALAGYETILYGSGTLAGSPLTGPALAGNAGDKGDDVGRLSAWLGTGKNLLVTGDRVVVATGSTTVAGGAAFVQNWLGCTRLATDVRPLIGGQAAPLIVPTPSNVVGFNTPFVAYGSCPAFRVFNGIGVYASPFGYSTKVGEFTAVNAYPSYAAMVSNHRTDVGSKIVTSMVDFGAWYSPYETAKDDPAPYAARTQVLGEILVWFGYTPSFGSTPTPTNGAFFAKNYPNPFNPVTKIEWSIPRAGDLSIKIFNVKGELVRTLHDGFSAESSGVEEWNGTSDSGRDVASGVYFYEVRSGDNVSVNKMALVK